MSGEPKTLTLEKRRESAAATILRHLQAGPATVVELMDRIHADTTRPKVGTPGWRIVTTHLVADTLLAVEALGDLLGQKFLSRDGRGAIALTLPLGVRVAARDEAAELRAALRTLVADLEDLMEESHIELYDGDGYLVGVSWGKLLQGGKDEYLSNWRDAKRLAGGESQS